MLQPKLAGSEALTFPFFMRFAFSLAAVLLFIGLAHAAEAGQSSDASTHLGNIAATFMELGAIVVGLSTLARFALHIGLTPIPFYLVAGLFLGQGGVLSLSLSKDFIGTTAEIGVVLLLFMLGLEYNGDELSSSLKRGLRGGLLDFALNFLPGFGVALLLGWNWLPGILLGGVTWISSSSIIAKVLGDLDRLGNRETSSILSILVLEDLAMAVYLPLVAVLLLGQSFLSGAISVGIALTTVTIVLILAIRHGALMTRAIAHESDEVLLSSVFGLVLLVAGIAQRLQVSSGIGAFLVGLALSGGVAHHARTLLGPLRDLFAATFFFFVGLQIDPATLPPALPTAVALAVVTSATKIVTGFQVAKWEGIAPRGRMRAGTALVARGEFSVVIAGLGASVEPRLAPLAAAYVLLLAIGGPVLTRYSEALSQRFQPHKSAPST